MDNQIALIIEDDKDAQKIFRKVLDFAGFETVIKSQGDLAIDYLKKHTPTIILLDMNLPVVNGSKILTYIRSEAHLTSTQVIVISADYAMSSANDNEADFVLMKPVDTRQLRQLVKRLQTVIS